MIILGALVSKAGGTEEAVQYRLKQARGTVWANMHVLTNPYIKLKHNICWGHVGLG